ncbi:MAG: stress response translation initiation inhibitor YciH [Candidatus Anstonellales archaeon]
MGEKCPTCNLPLELCVCDTLTREGAVKRIKIYTAKAKFKKFITIVEGIEKSQIKEIFKQLKSKLACGGSLKDDKIMLQGEHKKKAKELLIKMGYKENMIELGD